MRFVGNRALFGAAAMIAVGIILSMMASYYFANGSEDEGITRSRWWWEIVLNVEILSVAFIWFTHIDRVKAASGWQAAVRLLQMGGGIVAVLLPVWVALAAAQLGWFESRPPVSYINMVVMICLAAWMFVWLAVLAVQTIMAKQLAMPWFMRTDILWRRVVRISPMLLAFILIGIETNNGGVAHYIYCPFLFYLQGAMPYLARGVRFDGEADPAPDEGLL
ncbi:MAG: hypothetical protein HWE25_03565 [Alphaproteobacteria bacterium]|nr:hypothetical protein [Alphaproteobacteria bacterium]